MFLGWYDADKKTPITAKVDDALERYIEKFGSHPDMILMNSEGFEEVRAEFVDRYQVRAVSYIPTNTFYVGVEDNPA
jgi:hypothetical protein